MNFDGSKYDVENEHDRNKIIEMFDVAIQICSYSCEMMTYEPSDNMLRAMSLVRDHEEICYITLRIDKDDAFHVTIMNSFYNVDMILMDMNAILLAYLIRNATKVTDDYDDSINFFSKYFTLYPIFKDDELLSTMITHGIIEQTTVTFVLPSAYKARIAKA